ncbi:MAG: G5 domain-containing protein [Patescibacteria group bacterium]|nr:G5 domain-containing protein [Patescibacteria group bacterium]
MKKVLCLAILLSGIFVSWKAGSVWFFKERTLDFSGDKLITVNDNGFQYQITASAKTVGRLLDDVGITVADCDRIYPDQEINLFPGMIISLHRAIPIKIYVDGETRALNSFSSTVEKALHEAEVELSHLDQVSPSRVSGIEKDLEIVVTRINKEQTVAKEPIAFKIIEKKNPKLKWRKKKIQQEGVEGAKEVEYEITYKNGKQISKEKLSSKITEEPVTEIVSIGTKVKVGKTKIGVASWYAHTGAMACASRMFSKGTWLRVTNRENGKQVFVVVNDYGPQRGTGKMIDLDKIAFKKLASSSKGVIEVKVEEIID